MQLLSWAHPNIANLDIAILVVMIAYGISRCFDHLTGHLRDPYGLPHVQNENVPTARERSCQQHESRCLWDGHKEAGDLGVRNSHRTAGCNLLFKQRND